MNEYLHWHTTFNELNSTWVARKTSDLKLTSQMRYCRAPNLTIPEPNGEGDQKQQHRKTMLKQINIVIIWICDEIGEFTITALANKAESFSSISPSSELQLSSALRAESFLKFGNKRHFQEKWLSTVMPTVDDYRTGRWDYGKSNRGLVRSRGRRCTLGRAHGITDRRVKWGCPVPVSFFSTKCPAP